MKQKITTFFFFFTLSILSKGQNVKEVKNSLDSLSRLYNKKVIGYHKSISANPIPRVTFIIYYEKDSEMHDSVVWAKDLIGSIIITKENKSETKYTHESIPLGAVPIYYENTYIGYLVRHEFVRVTHDAPFYVILSEKIKSFLKDDEAIINHLYKKVGSGYEITIMN